MMQGYGIGEDQASSWLRMYGGALVDMVGNRLVGMGADEARQMGPVLEDFDLDMDSGTMTLYFSESVKGTMNNSFLVPVRQ